ncbi:hypothetical protein C0V97_03975 [Asaia sp. W19]|uniref:phage tail assembly chaperone n=1 Tax=Asaia sp. HN128 TaxID=3081234 RepID=UPI000F8E2F3F|nr:hypothetical protein C0V97_03975 [Asaia sp. W19]
MALRETTYTIPDGEDAGKVFVITRMPAMQADRWARHLVKALTRAGMALPPDAMEIGLSGLGGMAQAMFGQLEDEAADKALDALMATVKIQRDPNNPASRGQIIDADLEDPETLPRLQAEAFRMHLGFFKAAAYLISPLVQMLVPQAASDKPQPAA